jgi:hypothetical protein
VAEGKFRREPTAPAAAPRQSGERPPDVRLPPRWRDWRAPRIVGANMAAQGDTGPGPVDWNIDRSRRRAWHHRHARHWVRETPRPVRRRGWQKGSRWKLIPITLIGLIVVFAALAAAAALRGYHPLRDGVTELSQAITAVHKGNQSAATADLQQATSDFARAHSVLDVWWSEPAEYVPGVSAQLTALRSVASAGNQVCSAGLAVSKDLTSAGLPHGKALIAMLSRLEVTLKGSEAGLEQAQAQVSSARSSLLLPPISSRLEDAVTKVTEAAHDDEIGVSAVAAGVQFLGGDGPRSYFLAVQTEAESRASGGVIGNYGIITADDGTLHLTRFGTTTSLETIGNAATRKLTAPAAYVARYGQFEPSRYWANVPMSPDFPTVAEVIEGLYPQEGGFPVDGVISVDPFALADLLRATGPVTVSPWPRPIMASDAVAVLLHTQYNELNGTTRTNFLGDVTRTVWRRFTDGHLPNLETLVEDLRPALDHKDLLLASTSPTTEALLREINVAGAFSQPANSDFFAITTQNVAENKIDWYLRRAVDYQVSYVPGTGAINATATVTLHNLSPSSGQAPYIIGAAGRHSTTPGENRLYMTIYSPWVFTQATVNGKVLPLSQSRELGVWADSAFLAIPPGGTTTISVQLAGHLKPGSPYQLAMSRQPMVAPDNVSVDVVLPAGDSFKDPSGLSLIDGGREARARFALESNTSVSASV